jgi:hypothetical protein
MKLAVRKRFGRWYVFYGLRGGRKVNAALKAGGFTTLEDALKLAHEMLLKESLIRARAH